MQGHRGMEVGTSGHPWEEAMTLFDHLTDDERATLAKLKATLQDAERECDDLEEELEMAQDTKARASQKIRELERLGTERLCKAKADLEASLAELCQKPAP